MKSENKMKRPVLLANYTYKTADDFMRWWREQDACKKQTAKDQAARAHSQALMVWVDDGGVVG